MVKRELEGTEDVKPLERQKKDEVPGHESAEIILLVTEPDNEAQSQMEDQLAERNLAATINVGKATKSDDAGVLVHLRDDRVTDKLEEHWRLSNRANQPNLRSEDGQIKLKRIPSWLKMLGLRRWKKNLRLDFFRWYAKKEKKPSGVY